MTDQTVHIIDDDLDVVKALVAAAKVGQFDHVAQRARGDRTEIAAYDEAAQQLAEQGVTVVARPEWGDVKIRDIRHLRTGGDPLDAEAHADCPGRAAYIHVGRERRPVRSPGSSWPAP